MLKTIYSYNIICTLQFVFIQNITTNYSMVVLKFDYKIILLETSFT
jgi:hypothetical protein